MLLRNGATLSPRRRELCVARAMSLGSLACSRVRAVGEIFSQELVQAVRSVRNSPMQERGMGCLSCLLKNLLHAAQGVEPLQVAMDRSPADLNLMRREREARVRAVGLDSLCPALEAEYSGRGYLGLRSHKFEWGTDRARQRLRFRTRCSGFSCRACPRREHSGNTGNPE